MRVMVRPGLFSDPEAGSDSAALLGSRCAACGSHLFPRVDACTYCATEDPEPVELSTQGTLWSWTAVTASPPGYEGDVPFGIGIVELPEGIRIISRLTESDPAALQPGQPMEFRVVNLYADSEGNDVVTYAFAPR
ncbi:MAG TPA: Zn-ribbon domain-containing OB-fold protein [Acidimicrobiales bacterium]|jgi:uncharacterized OB-fold protein